MVCACAACMSACCYLLLSCVVRRYIFSYILLFNIHYYIYIHMYYIVNGSVMCLCMRACMLWLYVDTKFMIREPHRAIDTKHKHNAKNYHIVLEYERRAADLEWGHFCTLQIYNIDMQKNNIYRETNKPKMISIYKHLYLIANRLYFFSWWHTS